MNEREMSEDEHMSGIAAQVTRNFLVDADDLVDELLGAIKAQDWKNLKMQYQVGTLHADKQHEDDGFTLQAEWTEFEEEVQLKITVGGSEDTLPARQQECLDLINALFPNDIFRKVNEDN